MDGLSYTCVSDVNAKEVALGASLTDGKQFGITDFFVKKKRRPTVDVSFFNIKSGLT
jgi:hypothetical protein